MNRLELDNFLEFLDRNGHWCFSFQTALVYFQEPVNTLRHSLARHARAGTISRVAKGIYANGRANSKPIYNLESTVQFLRSGVLSYLSLETRLSELGMISQVPAILTFITEGRSQTFKTSFGTIEFTHTDRQLSIQDRSILFDVSRNIHIASPIQAVEDLKRCNRNLRLLDTQALVELQEEWLDAYAGPTL